LDEDTKSAGEE
jgi:hypothetical protein